MIICFGNHSNRKDHVSFLASLHYFLHWGAFGIFLLHILILEFCLLTSLLLHFIAYLFLVFLVDQLQFVELFTFDVL